MTNADYFKAFKDHLNKLIEKYTADLAIGKAKLDENFTHEFHWQMEAYLHNLEAIKLLKGNVEVITRIEAEGTRNFTDYITQMIREWLRRCLDQTTSKTSASLSNFQEAVLRDIHRAFLKEMYVFTRHQNIKINFEIGEIISYF